MKLVNIGRVSLSKLAPCGDASTVAEYGKNNIDVLKIKESYWPLYSDVYASVISRWSSVIRVCST